MIKPLTIILVALGMTGCAVERVVLPDKALSPAFAPTPRVGQVKVWCAEENDVKRCEQQQISISAVNENGCIETRSGKNEYTFCPNDGPYFIATSWKGPAAGDGSRKWMNTAGELWPLKTGNEYTFQENGTNKKGETWSRSGKLNVVGVERITVPAGTFDTYRVEIDLGDERFYLVNYAPSIESSVATQQISQNEHKAYYLLALVDPADEP